MEGAGSWAASDGSGQGSVRASRILAYMAQASLWVEVGSGDEASPTGLVVRTPQELHPLFLFLFLFSVLEPRTINLTVALPFGNIL